MPLVTHFCGVCGCRVPPEDLEVGQAVILNHVTYCRECAAKAGIEATAATPVRPAPRSASSARSASAPSARRPGPAAAHARRPARPAPRGPRRRAGGSSAALVGGALAITALLLVVVAIAVFASRNRGGEPESPGGTVGEAPVVPVPWPSIPEPGPDARPTPSAPDEETRREARSILAEVEGIRPDRDVALEELMAARDAAAAGRDRLKRLVESAGRPDRVLQGLQRRAETVAEGLAGRVDGMAKRIHDEVVEATTTYVATKNFDRARKVLKGVPPGFEKTEWGPRLAVVSTRIEDAYRAHLREEAARRDEGYTYVFTGQSLDGWIKQGSASWSLRDDGSGVRHLAARNDGGGFAKIGYVAPGSSGWQEYRFRVDIRKVKEDLGVFPFGPGGPSGWKGRLLKENRLPLGEEWRTLEIAIRGESVTLRFGPTVVHRGSGSVGIKGGFGFQLSPGGQVEVRNVRYKVTR